MSISQEKTKKKIVCTRKVEKPFGFDDSFESIDSKIINTYNEF